MTAITFETATRMAGLASAFRAVLKALGDLANSYAAYRIARSVSQLELRRCDREVRRYRQLMHDGRCGAASSTTRLPHALMVPRWTSSRT